MNKSKLSKFNAVNDQGKFVRRSERGVPSQSLGKRVLNEQPAGLPEPKRRKTAVKKVTSDEQAVLTSVIMERVMHSVVDNGLLCKKMILEKDYQGAEEMIRGDVLSMQEKTDFSHELCLIYHKDRDFIGLEKIATHILRIIDIDLTNYSTWYHFIQFLAFSYCMQSRYSEAESIITGKAMIPDMLQTMNSVRDDLKGRLITYLSFAYINQEKYAEASYCLKFALCNFKSLTPNEKIALENFQLQCKIEIDKANASNTAISDFKNYYSTTKSFIDEEDFSKASKWIAGAFNHPIFTPDQKQKFLKLSTYYREKHEKALPAIFGQAVIDGNERAEVYKEAAKQRTGYTTTVPGTKPSGRQPKGKG